ncbi:MAG TPA: mechanosensitive ion channel family protein [Jatrophihabitans sp.]|jgi:small conductance mechanosensitive channel|uniref:mechanosensitive ion channel family protein n=1 Tax=Jatrophihabitans sp. TaxID=1932789 RepID=UPI002E064DDB|nr:mechanosensitive ion channel family protein [Jatrophihabitans sp.]
MTLAVTPLNDVGLWARSNLLVVILLIVGAILVTRFANWVSNHITGSIDRQAEQTDVLVRSEAMKHRHAVTQVVTWTILVLIYCLTAVLVVRLLGFPISGFVAPATVAGVALGFGAQRVVQDLLSGFFIVTERQYGFGDVVRLAAIGTTPTTGTVEEVTLRITRIRSLDGEVITTPNGQIVQVTNLSRDWARAVIDVPVPVSADVTRVNDVLRAVCDEAFDDDKLRPLLLDPPSVMGIESIEVDQVNVRVVARCLPGKQFDVGRSLRARITIRLAREGITVAPALGTDESGGTD